MVLSSASFMHFANKVSIKVIFMTLSRKTFCPGKNWKDDFCPVVTYTKLYLLTHFIVTRSPDYEPFNESAIPQPGFTNVYLVLKLEITGLLLLTATIAIKIFGKCVLHLFGCQKIMQKHFPANAPIVKNNL